MTTPTPHYELEETVDGAYLHRVGTTKHPVFIDMEDMDMDELSSIVNAVNHRAMLVEALRSLTQFLIENDERWLDNQYVLDAQKALAADRQPRRSTNHDQSR
jgi:glucan phosphorylase